MCSGEKITSENHSGLYTAARYILLFMCGLCASAFSISGLASAAEAPSPNVVQQQTVNAIIDYTRNTKRAIDPRLVDQLANNVLLFTSSFCFTPPSSECAKNFQDTKKFSQILTKYLDKIVEETPEETRSIADQLSEGNLSSIGYPAVYKLEVATLKVPHEFEHAKSYLRTSAGLLPLADEAKLILMAAGPAILEFHSEQNTSVFNLNIKKGQRLSIEKNSEKNVGENEVSPGRGDLYPPKDAFCYSDAPSGTPVEPLWAFNWGRATFAEDPTIRNRNLAPFTQQPAISIRTKIAPSLQCGEDCEDDLGALFAQAIAAWRSGCSRCDANALVLVATGRSVWLDWRLWRRLQTTDTRNANAFDLAILQPDEAERLKMSPAWFGRSMVVPYTDISSDETTKARICALPDYAALWVGPVKQHLCPGKAKPQNELSPTVFFRDDTTACGSEAVACGLTYGNVEVNGAEYEFRVKSAAVSGEYRIGSAQSMISALDLWPVILHEVGHWFGVPHADIAGSQAAKDIMAPAYGTGASCVSSQSLTMLNNASDIRWKFRAASGGALLPPP